MTEIQISSDRDDDVSSFGKQYLEYILQLIHSHLELDTHHTLAYVGPPGTLVQSIEKYFCLLTPVTLLSRGTLAFTETTGKSRRFPLKLSAAEEYFREASADKEPMKRRFDRILMVDSAQYYNNMQTTFRHATQCLRKSGKVLIIHRSPSVSTLPLFKKANCVLRHLETPFMKIVNALQAAGCAVEWDMKHAPIRMRPHRWISLLRSRYLPEIGYMSDNEIEEGIEELRRGLFCYMTPDMELEDRLLLVTGTPVDEHTSPALQRVNDGPQQPYFAINDLDYTMCLKKSYQHYL